MQVYGGANQGYEGASQSYAAAFQVVEGGQLQGDFGLGGDIIYDPHNSVHNMSDSDTEAGDGLPDVRFGEEDRGSPARPLAADPVVEAMDRAEIDASDLEQEIQAVVGNEALSLLLTKANQMVKEANARTKEANARNRKTTMEKDAADE